MSKFGGDQAIEATYCSAVALIENLRQANTVDFTETVWFGDVRYQISYLATEEMEDLTSSYCIYFEPRVIILPMTLRTDPPANLTTRTTTEKQREERTHHHHQPINISVDFCPLLQNPIMAERSRPRERASQYPTRSRTGPSSNQPRHHQRPTADLDLARNPAFTNSRDQRYLLFSLSDCHDSWPSRKRRAMDINCIHQRDSKPAKARAWERSSTCFGIASSWRSTLSKNETGNHQNNHQI